MTAHYVDLTLELLLSSKAKGLSSMDGAYMHLILNVYSDRTTNFVIKNYF